MRSLQARLLLLALAGTLAIGSAVPAIAQTGEHAADLAELTAYTLTADTLAQVVQANAEVDAAAAADPDVKKAADGMAITSNDGFPVRTASAQSSAKVVAILQAHGFTPHEFVVASMEWFMAGTAVSMIRAGSPREETLNHPGVNKASVEALENSPDAFDALQKKLATAPH